MTVLIQDSRDAFSPDGPEIAVREEAVDKSVSRHVHTFYEMMLVRRGYGYYAHRQTVNVLLPGDVAIARPGVAHALPQCGAMRMIVCAFTREAAEAQGRVSALPGVRAFMQPGDAICLRPPESTFNEMAELMGRMLREQDARSAGYGAMLSAMLSEALILASRAETAPARDTEDALPLTLVGKVARYVEENYASPIGAEEMAACAGMSADHLARRFRQVAGMTPVEYLRAYRMERALEMLREGMSAADTAKAVGVNDQGQFSRQFKKILGFTPNLARRRDQG